MILFYWMNELRTVLGKEFVNGGLGPSQLYYYKFKEIIPLFT